MSVYSVVILYKGIHTRVKVQLKLLKLEGGSYFSGRLKKLIPDLESAHCKILKLIWSHQKSTDNSGRPNPQIFYQFGPMQDERTVKKSTEDD